MKSIVYTIILLSFMSSVSVYAQQDEQYTQFMLNKLWYNPAYAGGDGSATLGILTRSQWIGIEGAPKAQVLSFDRPLLNNEVGLGVTVIHTSIGVTEQFTLTTDYAYRKPLWNGYLSVGLKASLRHLRVDYTEIEATQPIVIDEAIPRIAQSKLVPNFGTGIYYQSERFYTGFSVPRLLKSNIDLSDNSTEISREIQHYYFMGGVILGNGDAKVKVLPQFLMKYTQNGPFDADLNLSFIFLNRLILGATYRLGGARENSSGESVDALFGVHIKDNVVLGLSYDFTLSELKRYTDGSVEASLRISFGEGNEEKPKFYDNARYF